MDFEPLVVLAISVGGIATVVGVVFFLLRKSLPPVPRAWLFEDRPWLVNLGVVVFSVGISFLGAWLNWAPFEMRSSVEYVWRGLFSAAVSTFGYEFSKNLGRAALESFG